MFRCGLIALFASQPGWSVVGEAENGEQAVQMVAQRQPDITILDLRMPVMDGLEATREMMKLTPKPSILILTMYADKQLVHDLLEAGAKGYVMKADAGRYLITAMETVMEGKLFFTTTVCEILLNGFLEKPAPPRSVSQITKRETEVLKLLADGKTNKQIASDLEISMRTVETHRASIMQKLQMNSVQELVRYAVKNKLVE
ncbi:MAG TPA: response regulator transcription factor [Bryobacteraceae bacterium]